VGVITYAVRAFRRRKTPMVRSRRPSRARPSTDTPVFGNEDTDG